eukprot:c39887_g1_i1.p1 GENE.c39887_g1_i1~~c39887_g1_i1.p1  ORF type:complete len:234 (-),score=63.83 c39887_g1_i1:97-744(-)
MTDPWADQEMRLWNDADEREKHETLADLFSIIKTVEHLEKAYIRDSITPKEYETECKKLIAKFKTIKKMMETEIPDISRDFLSKFNLHKECPAAIHRLLNVGVPATAEHGGGDSQQLAVHVAQVVQHFITLMDYLELGQKAVPELFRYLRDLAENLGKITSLPAEFGGTEKVQKWLTKINAMDGSDELSDEDARSMSLDIEKAYDQFHKCLQSDA